MYTVVPIWSHTSGRDTMVHVYVHVYVPWYTCTMVSLLLPLVPGTTSMAIPMIPWFPPVHHGVPWYVMVHVDVPWYVLLPRVPLVCRYTYMVHYVRTYVRTRVPTTMVPFVGTYVCRVRMCVPLVHQWYAIAVYLCMRSSTKLLASKFLLRAHQRLDGRSRPN